MEKHEFDLKMRTSDMFTFMMYQQYSGFKGFVVLFINALVIYCLITRWSMYQDAPKLLLFFVLFLFDIWMPLQLLLRAKNQVVAASRFKGDTHYSMSEEGMKVSKEGEILIFKWPHFLKYKVMCNRIFVYTSRITAFVLPKDLLGSDNYSFLLDNLKKNKSALGTLSIQTAEHILPEDETESTEGDNQ